jgi:hypothetical protein
MSSFITIIIILPGQTNRPLLMASVNPLGPLRLGIPKSNARGAAVAPTLIPLCGVVVDRLNQHSLCVQAGNFIQRKLAKFAMLSGSLSL